MPTSLNICPRMDFSITRMALVACCLAPVLALASPAGFYNCFLTYKEIPKPQPSNGDQYCFSAMFSIDFDRKLVDGVESCARLQNDWVHQSLISRNLSFTATGNQPINGVTRLAIQDSGEVFYLNLMSVNSGNSMFVQTELLGGSGICHWP